MTVLGRGDLAPPRRPRRRRPWLAGVLVLVVLAGAGYLAWREWGGGSSPAAAPAPRTCVTPSAPARPAAAGAVSVSVLNSTKRNGLAHGLVRALRARGFHVGRVGNTTPVQPGTAVVRYGPGGQAAALAVAEQVAGATTTPAAAPGVTLVLGAHFTRLAAPSAVASARARDVAAASPRPAVCTSP